MSRPTPRDPRGRSAEQVDECPFRFAVCGVVAAATRVRVPPARLSPNLIETLDPSNQKSLKSKTQKTSSSHLLFCQFLTFLILRSKINTFNLFLLLFWFLCGCVMVQLALMLENCGDIHRNPIKGLGKPPEGRLKGRSPRMEAGEPLEGRLIGNNEVSMSHGCSGQDSDTWTDQPILAWHMQCEIRPSW